MSPPSVPSTRAGSATGISSSPAAFARWRRACLAWCWSCFSSALMRARAEPPSAPRSSSRRPRRASATASFAARLLEAPPAGSPSASSTGARSKRPGGPRRRPGPRQEARPAGRLAAARRRRRRRAAARTKRPPRMRFRRSSFADPSPVRASPCTAAVRSRRAVSGRAVPREGAAARWCCLRSTRLTDAALRCSGVMARRRLSERSLSLLPLLIGLFTPPTRAALLLLDAVRVRAGREARACPSRGSRFGRAPLASAGSHP